MIMVLNGMKDKKLAASFERAVLRPIEKSGQQAECIQVTGSEKLPDPANYSHVILSGSEASTLDDNPWDAPLAEVIHQCVNLSKPFLGICYGHQFLARTLAGKSHVAKAETPEFGWTKIMLQENPLFKGLAKEYYCMVCHYDMVKTLPTDFKQIGASAQCPIHAFQYGDLPIWGVQFHPECNAAEAQEIFAALKEEEPQFATWYEATDAGKANDLDNERLFLNFLSF